MLSLKNFPAGCQPAARSQHRASCLSLNETAAILVLALLANDLSAAWSQMLRLALTFARRALNASSGPDSPPLTLDRSTSQQVGALELQTRLQPGVHVRCAALQPGRDVRRGRRKEK